MSALDLLDPVNVGQARWTGWGGCWTCRRRAPDGGPLMPCGCPAPGPREPIVLEAWEATPAAWLATVQHLQPHQEVQSAAVPRDPEAVLPGSFDGRWGAPTGRPAKQPPSRRHRRAG